MSILNRLTIKNLRLNKKRTIVTIIGIILSTALMVGIAINLVCMMMLSRWLKKQSIFMERTFIQNLRFRDMHAEFTGQKRPEYEGHLLSRDIHLSDFEVPADSLWAGHTLKELNLGYK